MRGCHVDNTDGDDDTTYMPLHNSSRYYYNVIDMILDKAKRDIEHKEDEEETTVVQDDTAITLSLDDINKMLEHIIKEKGYILPLTTPAPVPTSTSTKAPGVPSLEGEFTNTIKEDFGSYSVDVIKVEDTRYTITDNNEDYDYDYDYDYKCKRKIKNYTNTLYIITIILLSILTIMFLL